MFLERPTTHPLPNLLLPTLPFWSSSLRSIVFHQRYHVLSSTPDLVPVPSVRGPFTHLRSLQISNPSCPDLLRLPASPLSVLSTRPEFKPVVLPVTTIIDSVCVSCVPSTSVSSVFLHYSSRTCKTQVPPIPCLLLW